MRATAYRRPTADRHPRHQRIYGWLLSTHVALVWSSSPPSWEHSSEMGWRGGESCQARGQTPSVRPGSTELVLLCDILLLSILQFSGCSGDNGVLYFSIVPGVVFRLYEGLTVTQGASTDEGSEGQPIHRSAVQYYDGLWTRSFHIRSLCRSSYCGIRMPNQYCWRRYIPSYRWLSPRRLSEA